MNLILFGAPGTGKGTQSEFLVKQLGMVQISTGDLFRTAIKNRTELGIQAKLYIDQGILVPNAVTLGIVEGVLREIKSPFVLDGFPRNLEQGRALEKLLDSLNLKLGKVVSLEVPGALLVARLMGRRVCRSCGAVFHLVTKPPKKEGVCDVCQGELYQRPDDTELVIRDRLKVYEEYTAPLKDFYSKQGLLVQVDGNRSAQEIFEELKKIAA